MAHRPGGHDSPRANGCDRHRFRRTSRTTPLVARCRGRSRVAPSRAPEPVSGPSYGGNDGHHLRHAQRRRRRVGRGGRGARGTAHGPHRRRPRSRASRTLSARRQARRAPNANRPRRRGGADAPAGSLRSERRSSGLVGSRAARAAAFISARIAPSEREATTGAGTPATWTCVRRPRPRPSSIGSTATMSSARTSRP